MESTEKVEGKLYLISIILIILILLVVIVILLGLIGYNTPKADLNFEKNIAIIQEQEKNNISLALQTNWYPYSAKLNEEKIELTKAYTSPIHKEGYLTFYNDGTYTDYVEKIDMGTYILDEEQIIMKSDNNVDEFKGKIEKIDDKTYQLIIDKNKCKITFIQVN